MKKSTFEISSMLYISVLATLLGLPLLVPSALGQEPLDCLAIQTSPLIVFVTEPVDFSAAVSGGVPPITYSWDLNGDGIQDSASPTPMHYIYSPTGTFTASLTVSDSVGQVDTCSESVVVNPEPSFIRGAIEWTTHLTTVDQTFIIKARNISPYLVRVTVTFTITIDTATSVPGLVHSFDLMPGQTVPSVEVDVKPGSDPNSVNLKSQGVIPVAILTTPGFDAAAVDPSTVSFGNIAIPGLVTYTPPVRDTKYCFTAVLSYDNIRDPGTSALLQTVGGTDGSKSGCFSVTLLSSVGGGTASPGPATPVRQALEDVDGDGDLDLVLHFNIQDTGIQVGATTASLTGRTFDGSIITGVDSIRVFLPGDVNGDLIVNIADHYYGRQA